AGVDQYVESVPGSSCNHSSSGPGGGHNGSLPPGTGAQLSNQGAVGQAVKRLVSSTGPGSGAASPSSSGSSSGGRARGAGRAKAPASHGSASNTGALSGSGHSPLTGILHPVLTGSSS